MRSGSVKSLATRISMSFLPTEAAIVFPGSPLSTSRWYPSRELLADDPLRRMGKEMLDPNLLRQSGLREVSVGGSGQIELTL